MILHEDKLKKIIKAIEKYAAVTKVEINNSVTTISVPRTNKVIELDMNKPSSFSIYFLLGNEKEVRGINHD